MGRKRKHSDSPRPNRKSSPPEAETPGSSSSSVDASPTSSPSTDGSTDSRPSAAAAAAAALHQRNAAANERERARMRVLSRAFGRLKTSLPWVPADTKLSKLDTLRLASCYIAHLSRMLAAADEAGDENGGGGGGATDADEKTAERAMNCQPQQLTWPFTFNWPRTSSNAVVSSTFQQQQPHTASSRDSSLTPHPTRSIRRHR